jgi:hypothetical protein
VVEEGIGRHRVEGGVGEGQRLGPRLVQPDRLRQRADPRHHLGRDVDAVDVVEQADRVADDEAGAAADVEQATARAGGADVGEAGAHLGLVLRTEVRLGGLVHVGQAGVDAPVGLEGRDHAMLPVQRRRSGADPY